MHAIGLRWRLQSSPSSCKFYVPSHTHMQAAANRLTMPASLQDAVPFLTQCNTNSPIETLCEPSLRRLRRHANNDGPTKGNAWASPHEELLCPHGEPPSQESTLAAQAMPLHDALSSGDGVQETTAARSGWSSESCDSSLPEAEPSMLRSSPSVSSPWQLSSDSTSERDRSSRAPVFSVTPFLSSSTNLKLLGASGACTCNVNLVTSDMHILCLLMPEYQGIDCKYTNWCHKAVAVLSSRSSRIQGLPLP